MPQPKFTPNESKMTRPYLACPIIENFKPNQHLAGIEYAKTAIRSIVNRCPQQHPTRHPARVSAAWKQRLQVPNGAEVRVT